MASPPGTSGIKPPLIAGKQRCGHPEEAAASDIVVTATAATQPVLEGRWLRPGAHVNPIGAHTRRTREIDTEAVACFTVGAEPLPGTRAWPELTEGQPTTPPQPPTAKAASPSWPCSSRSK